MRIRILLTTAVLIGCVNQSARAQTSLTTEVVASGLTRPVYVTAPPADFDRLFIVEKLGVIKVLNLGAGTVNGTPFLDINSVVGGSGSQTSEQGLLGLAFHPNYASNGFFYVYYTDNFSDTVVARYTVSANPDIANSASAVQVMTFDQPQANHNGGWIGFGPDGFLYIASGDGGGAGDDDQDHTPGVGNGQDITNNLLGKMLRIDVNSDDFPGDAGANYGIPGSNPFVGVTGDDEIWAYGLRNHWRNSFDRATGDLYIADVGQQLWEEINIQPASSAGGENYGWRCREGLHDFNTSGDCSQTPFTEPVQEYSHGGSPFRCSISGGYVYRGCAIPDLRGTYFYADWCSDQIWSFRWLGAVTEFQQRTSELDPAVGSIIDIVSFGEDAAGELYIVEQNLSGEIFRIIPDGAVSAPTPNDFDNNGTVNLFDGARFGDCSQGPGTLASQCICDVYDHDGDNDVDLDDYRNFQNNFGS